MRLAGSYPMKELVIPEVPYQLSTAFMPACVHGDNERVNHRWGEQPQEEDGDGFCKVHVNTMEGFWSL